MAKKSKIKPSSYVIFIKISRLNQLIHETPLVFINVYSDLKPKKFIMKSYKLNRKRKLRSYKEKKAKTQQQKT